MAWTFTHAAASAILRENVLKQPVRLIGVSVSSLERNVVQMPLFVEERKKELSCRGHGTKSTIASASDGDSAFRRRSYRSVDGRKCRNLSYQPAMSTCLSSPRLILSVKNMQIMFTCLSKE